MIRKNKKAQLGKLIVSFPIMLIVFVIMGIFIFLATTISIIKGEKENPTLVGVVPGEDLMLKQISVDLGDGKGVQNMLVVDAISFYINGSYERGSNIHTKMYKSLGKLMSDGDLLFIFDSKKDTAIDSRWAKFYLTKNGNELIDETENQGGADIWDIYYNRGNIRTITLSTENGKVYLHYYLGKKDLEVKNE